MPKIVGKITPLLLTVLVLLLPARLSAGNAADLAKGAMANFVFARQAAPAPQVGFVDGEEREVSLEDFRGRTVLLNFWATWCGPCRTEMPGLDRLQAKLGGDRFIVLALSADRQGPDVVPAYYRESGIEHLAIYNDRTMRVARAFGVPGLPTTVLLGPNGLEIGRLIGPAEWDSAEAEALIAYFLDEFAKR